MRIARRTMRNVMTKTRTGALFLGERAMEHDMIHALYDITPHMYG